MTPAFTDTHENRRRWHCLTNQISLAAKKEWLLPQLMFIPLKEEKCRTVNMY